MRLRWGVHRVAIENCLHEDVVAHRTVRSRYPLRRPGELDSLPSSLPARSARTRAHADRQEINMLNAPSSGAWETTSSVLWSEDESLVVTSAMAEQTKGGRGGGKVGRPGMSSWFS